MNLRSRHPSDCHSEQERFYRDNELACRGRESAFRFCLPRLFILRLPAAQTQHSPSFVHRVGELA